MAKRRMVSAVSLLLLACVLASPAIAAGPRASDGNDWPEMSQPNTGSYSGYRPDSAEKCGIYDDYCYYRGRLSLDNTGRNR